jgi:hypothetical protein
MVGTVRGSHENGPTSSVNKCRQKHLRPRRGSHVPVLIKNDAIEVKASERFRIVGSVKADSGSIMWEFHKEARLGNFRSVRLGVILEILPCDLLSLIIEGSDVSISRVFSCVVRSFLDKIVDRRYCLSGSTVGDEDGPSLVSSMEVTEVPSWLIGKFDAWHSTTSCWSRAVGAIRWMISILVLSPRLIVVAGRSLAYSG